MDGVFSDSEEGLEALDNVEDLRDMAQAAPVIRLVNNAFRDAITQGASDIHISPYEEGLEIRFRVDGVLRLVNTVSRKFQAAIISRVKIMSNLDIAERRIPQDGRIRLKMDHKDFDIRVAVTPTVFGEGVVMRILDKSSIQVDISDVGFEPEMLKTWLELIHRPHGIVLVTGPTGSGKTTTLYASLNHIKSPELKLITTEDPVEYQLHGVDQIQVNAKVGLTFAAALRSILRQDPDVIMVGEIRDYETAEIAIQSALTGHLVLSTLHTNDAATAVTRLVEMGVAPYLVAPTLGGALAQRLVRKLCPQCKAQDADGKWRAVGCEACEDSGYKGRLGIFEMLVNTPGVQALISNQASAADIAAQGRKEGMLTLLEDGLAKAARGLTTEEEVRRVAL
jgi:general secretion pathway protein E